MSRAYLVFGSDDEVQWELLTTVEANGSEQALNKARGQESHRYYAACPERNWASGAPEVIERDPVVKWKMKHSVSEKSPKEQITVDEVLKEAETKAEIKEAVKEAKETLHSPMPSPDDDE